jgi:MOSC domain-containing protein YiiM
MSGRLIGIARVKELRAPLEEMESAAISKDTGIEGDARGMKRGRQVTVLFREGWDDACRDVGVALPWVTRRANLYVEGVERPRAIGGHIAIGDVVLVVRQETDPCDLMERAQLGLRQALTPDWRGGVCCEVLQGGTIRKGDAVILS